MFRSALTPIPAQVRLVAYLLGGAGVVLELAALFVFSHLDAEASVLAERARSAECYPMPRGPLIALPSLELAL